LKTSILLCAALACIAVAMPADAGEKTATHVTLAADWFSGTYGDARASSDANQELSCSVNISGGGGAPTAFCIAQDSTGQLKACFIKDATPYLPALATLTPFSSLWVSFDSNGSCLYLNVENSSYFTPITP
jgi:hypothetical protein